MSHYIVVDDRELDRQSLSMTLNMVSPNCSIGEADGIDEMYARLAEPIEAELIFMDVSLDPGADEPDSDGLGAIYDIALSYPCLPIAIVTGYAAKSTEVLNTVPHIRTYVGFLDKGSYSVDDVQSIVQIAGERRTEWMLKKEFTDEVFEEAVQRVVEAEKRLDKERTLLEEQVRSQGRRGELFQIAYSGNQWQRRAAAEKELFGNCDLNALYLGREVEAQIISKSVGVIDRLERPTIRDRVNWISDVYRLNPAESKLVWKAWTIRNAVLHPERRGRIEDVRLFADVLTILGNA